MARESKGITLPIIYKANLDGLKQAEGALGGFTKKLAGVAAGIAAAFSIRSITNFAKEAILAAEGVATANARIGQIAKSTALFGDETDAVTNRLIKFAEAQEMRLAVDAEVIKSVQGQLLTFKALGQSADETNGIFDRTTEAAFNMAAAGFGSAESNAIQLGKALEDPIRGLTALRRSGTTFTAEQQELIKTLVQSGDLLGAQELILAELESQYGGVAEATANASDRLSLAFDNIKETAGAALLPIFQNLVQGLLPILELWGEELAAVFEGLSPVFDTLVQRILDLFSALTPLLPILGTISQLFFELVAAILPLITSVLNILLPLFASLLPIVTELISAALLPLIDIFSSLLEIALPLIEELLPVFIDIFEALGEAAIEVVAALAPIVQQLLPILQKIIEPLVPLIVQLADKLGGIIVLAIEQLAGAVVELLTAFSPLIPIIGDVLVRVFELLLDIFVQLLPEFMTLIDAILPIAIQLFETIVPIILQLVEAFLPLIEAILPVFLSIFEALAPIILEIIKAFMPLIHATLPLLVELLEFLTPILQWLADLLSDILIWAIEKFASFLAWLGEKVDLFAKSFAQNWYDLQVAVVNIINGLIGGFERMVNAFVRTINRVIEGVNRLRVALNQEPIKMVAEIELGRVPMPELPQILWPVVPVTVGSTGSGYGSSAAAARVGRGVAGSGYGLSAAAAIPAMAAGGLVRTPTLALIGEAGPEAVIPLDKMPQGGTVYNITVNAGLGTNGTQLGAEIVSLIKRYERSSGPVFASA